MLCLVEQNLPLTLRALLRATRLDAMAAKRYPRTISCLEGLVVKSVAWIPPSGALQTIYEEQLNAHVNLRQR